MGLQVSGLAIGAALAGCVMGFACCPTPGGNEDAGVPPTCQLSPCSASCADPATSRCPRMLASTDPSISAATIDLPVGAAPLGQHFTIAIDQGVRVGSRLGDVTTAGYAISFTAEGSPDYTFPATYPCVRLTIPYDPAFVATVPSQVRPTLGVSQVLTGGARVEVVADIDTFRHTASFCTKHLSTYVVTRASECTPIDLGGTIVGNRPEGALSVALETPVSFAIPAAVPMTLRGTGLGYVEVSVRDSVTMMSVACNYQAGVAMDSATLNNLGCHDGRQAGETITTQEVHLGAEGGDRKSVV